MNTPKHRWWTLHVAVLCLLAGQTASHAQWRNIITEIKGDTECIERAERLCQTWMCYNKVRNDLLKQGLMLGSLEEAMRWEADCDWRASWRDMPYNPSHMRVPLGRVDGEYNTRYGAIPRAADIECRYLHDWTVQGIFGWGSDRQPRVESQTIIVLKKDSEATIEFVNEINMLTDGKISGTSDAKGTPWPQQGEHDVTLTAIDINGDQHTIRVTARATALPLWTIGSSSGQSQTSSWTVSGGVSISESGPSVTLGKSSGESQTVSTSQSQSRTLPMVAPARYERSYRKIIPKTVNVDCGGQVRVWRAAQVTGYYYTKSFAAHGSVHSEAINHVSNTLTIHVTCRKCSEPGGGGTGTGSQPGTTPGSGTGSEPGTTPEPGSIPPRKPITPSGGDPCGYGYTRPSGLEPLELNGLIWTPVHGGAGDFGDFWNNPVIRAGGCIYIEPNHLPPYVQLIDQDMLSDPDFGAIAQAMRQEGQVPMLLPEPNSVAVGNLLAVGYLTRNSRIEPFEHTEVYLLPGVDQLHLDGPFTVRNVETGAADVFNGGALITFVPGSSVNLSIPPRVVSPAGLQLSEQTLTFHDAQTRVYNVEEPADDGAPLIHGAVIEDPFSSGTFHFTHANSPISPPPIWGNAVPEVDTEMEWFRLGDGILRLEFRVDQPALELWVERSTDLDTWEFLGLPTVVDEGSGLFAFEQTVDPLAEPVYTRIVAAPMASTFFSDPDPLTVDDAYTWIESRYAETPIDPEVCSMLFPMIDPEGKETVWARMGIGTPANDALTKFLEFLPAMSEVHQQIRQLAQIRANEGLDPDESLCLEIEAIHLEADSEQLYRGFLGLVDHAEEMRGETAP